MTSGVERIIISSDSHYDTKYEVDRMNDIDKTQWEIIKEVVDNRAGKNTIYINMGDVFDNNKPSPVAFNKVLDWIVYLEKSSVLSFIMSGNHDGKELVNALTFIKTLRLNNVHLVDDITFITRKVVVNKVKYDINMLFIPHINKQVVMQNYMDEINEAIYKKDRKLVKKLKDVDIYIENQARNFIELISKMDGKQINLVFTHLNVDGAKLGPADVKFKTHTLELPNILRNCKLIDYIFCGHIHKAQVIPNKKGYPPIIIPGSIQTLRFDERTDEKFYVELDIECLVRSKFGEK